MSNVKKIRKSFDKVKNNSFFDKKNRAAMIGAAFLMATSAVGPGFLTQTAVFTEKLMSCFAYVILLAIILNTAIQVNIWQIIAVTKKRGQDIANAVFPGLGYLVSVFIIFGGLAFNIGNIAGGGLGLNTLTGLNSSIGAVITAILCILIFLSKEAGVAMDRIVKILGILMILLLTYVMRANEPPHLEALYRSVKPINVDFYAIITIIGGSLGGYITFAGGHRLLEAGICGKENLRKVTETSILGIAVASIIRVLLFLAVLGVVVQGFKLDPSNPPASVFKIAAGKFGLILFGLLLWASAVTSVIGAAYTSVSFLYVFHPSVEKNRNKWIISFICFSTVVFVCIGKPVFVLVLAGALNGLIIPLILGSVLLAAHNKKIVKDYKHPVYLSVFGWLVFIATVYFAYETLANNLHKILNF